VLRSVPQIRELDDTHLYDVDPLQVRRQAADALADLLAAHRRERPLVLVLDNLQWADLDSVQLLEAVLLRPQPPKLALLCSYHEGADTTRPPLMRLLASLRATEHMQMHTLAIGPFSEAQASALAAHHLGLAPADPLPQRIAREAQGSPFFIGELARFARARGGLADSVASLNLDEVIACACAPSHPPPAASSRSSPSPAAASPAPSRSRSSPGHRRRRRPRHPRTPPRRTPHPRRRLRGRRPRDLPRPHPLHRRPATSPSTRATTPDCATPIAPSPRPCSPSAATPATSTTPPSPTTSAPPTTSAAPPTSPSLAAEEAAAQLAFERAAELFAALLALGGLGPREATRVRVQLAESLANSGQLYAAAKAYARPSTPARAPARPSAPSGCGAPPCSCSRPASTTRARRPSSACSRGSA
jgi:hypothetical protein